MRAERRLMVIVSLDVSGFTQLVQEDERATLSELALIRRELLEGTVKRRHGTVFKTMGDGALIEFPNIDDAVRWTVEFQQAMLTRNRQRSGRPLQVRAGIALADVFVEAEDRFGAAVAFVVRLQEVAPRGGIAITHSVRWQLGKSLQTNFTQVVRSLKGIEDPVEVWVWDPADPDLGSRPAPIVAGPPQIKSDRPSIVVLRFENWANDPDVDPIVDGVVEEITAALSRVHDFTVIARNSAYAYGAKPTDLREVSRVLGARYVLQGSVRRAGNTVRITAQLLDSSDATHLWSERFTGELTDVFELEDRIAEGVAGALHPSIRTAEIRLAQRQRPDSLAAYDLMMRALPNLWAHRRSRNAAAIAELTQALKLDPTYARAAALKAWAHAQQVCYNWTSDYEAERSEGQSLIDFAADHVSDDPTALTALSTGVMLLFADLDRAKVLVDRALTIDSNHAWAWTRLGFLHVYRGDPAAGQTCFERGLRLSPLDPFSFNGFIGLGLAAFAKGHPAEAAGWTQRAVGEKPGVTWMFRDLAVFLAHAGQHEAAEKALARFVASRPRLSLGDVDQALGFMEQGLRSRYIEGLRIAGMPATPGD